MTDTNTKAAATAAADTGAKVAVRNTSMRKFVIQEIELFPGKIIHLVEAEAKRLLKLYPGELEDVKAATAKALKDSGEEVAAAAATIPAAAAPAAAVVKDPADMKAVDLKAELDAASVDYHSTATKADLVALVEDLRTKQAAAPAAAA